MHLESDAGVSKMPGRLDEPMSSICTAVAVRVGELIQQTGREPMIPRSGLCSVPVVLLRYVLEGQHSRLSVRPRATEAMK